tara:strand:+ start:3253 stop:3945 length:693 start_codon:yes stop_codon:yes gene_type:complete
MLKSLLFISIPLLFFSCSETIEGDGNLTSEERKMESFTDLKISGMFNVVLVQGEPSVLIETDQNLLEHITTVVKDEELHISSGDKYLSTDQMVVTVFYRSLEKVEISGACELISNGSINGDELFIEISGAAEADLTLNVTKFRMELSGGSEIELHGIADEVELDLSGAAEVHAFNLESKRAAIGVSGAGDVEINASEKLAVDISGAGEVQYMGDPEIKKDISGVGEITKK